jgi:predicted TIM-barrel fold metal-dependent hydrolase
MRLPIKLHPVSNGEVPPAPAPPQLRRVQLHAAATLAETARRVGVSRREFLIGSCGAATMLGAMNEAFGALGNTGGVWRLPKEARYETAAADAAVSGREFVMDVHTHMVDPAGPWRRVGFVGWLRGRVPEIEGWLRTLPQAGCGEKDATRCFSAEHFIKDILLDSDTDAAVLSFFPAVPGQEAVQMTEAARLRTLADALDGSPRLLLHAMIMPNLPPFDAQLEAMREAAERWRVKAWKLYTHWGPPPNGPGFRLDDPRIGIPMIEEGRRLGVKVFCVHKGLSGQGDKADWANCADIGRVARRYPDVKFLVYHSGFQSWWPEGPHDARATDGIDGLVNALALHGIAPGANVWAELGTTWRELMRDPTAAAHAMGKLLLAVGPERILWGTDSLWYGSPQDQIQAFRAFEIAPELRERYGYPALDATTKARILGLNAASVYGLDPARLRRHAATDPVGRIKAGYLEQPSPSLATYGPENAAEYAALVKARGNWPD